ncbi:type VII secretion target [Streptomyces sp. DSM 44917]|uniref:Type VII secretion target n=1 Tax=Streptomyces boetiae TaxID=3075541 RepID=A0ABU2LGD0_9ACTN|nr:type VII secretion target [Streptomyces sp. DSM 44917]MDT0310297.1 type VII secretion target [Streptomyces sp. DSM 44917]
MEDAGVRTRLNSPEGGGGGSASWADLDVDTQVLERLARRSESLVEALDDALAAVRGDGVGGVATSASLGSLHRLERVATSWDARLSLMRQECVTLGQGLGAAAGMLTGAEEDARGSLAALEPTQEGDQG